jgi:hypothetical protein
MPVPSYKVITYGWDRRAGLQHDAALLHQELVDLGHSAVCSGDRRIVRFVARPDVA